ncbi:MAG: DUF1501 domain-containing protein [Betaproteobacteria bacterium]|nr:DUF1501 domain-containing protein [Betaproteobacteria bacterium]
MPPSRSRRQFLQWSGALAAASVTPGLSFAENADFRNLLILIELKGANDGLNTVIPYEEAAYKALRPRLAIPRDQVLQLNPGTGLHPALKPLLPLWEQKELAVVQGIGYPSPNLSHFRSIEIWDTASRSDEYLDDGWLTRAFKSQPVPRSFAADGIVVGATEMGPLQGLGTRAIAVSNTENFLRQARLARPVEDQRNSALRHILSVERDIVQAAGKLNAHHTFKTDFPQGAFGNQVKTAAQLIASNAGIAVVRLSLGGFDTHVNQPGIHAGLLKQIADGMEALKAALIELNRWNSTLVMTYAEFGRRPKENQSNGTDHGTANTHFIMGGRVKGGLYGQAPQLERLDGNGNLPFGVDFRSVYATALDKWWGVDSKAVFGQKFAPLDLIRA